MKLHWKPSEFALLPQKEKALVCAFIEEMIKSRQQEEKELERIRGTGK